MGCQEPVSRVAAFVFIEKKLVAEKQKYTAQSSVGEAGFEM